MQTEHIPVAVAWLQSNEGDKFESAACKEAADFLIKEFNERIIQRLLYNSNYSREQIISYLKNKYNWDGTTMIRTR